MNVDENDWFTEDCVLFSDEDLFDVNGEVKLQNVQFDAKRVRVRCTPTDSRRRNVL